MRISRLVSFAAVLGFAANAANAEGVAPTHCNLGTLHGTMAWSSTVLTATGAASSGSGQESYDGKGKMRYYEFSSDRVTTSTYTGTGAEARHGDYMPGERPPGRAGLVRRRGDRLKIAAA